MSNALVSIAYGDVPGFPVGSAVDHVAVTCIAVDPANSGLEQDVAPGTVDVTFANLNPDTYTFTAQAFSSAGVAYGTAVSTSLTIAVPVTVTLSLPSGVTASQP